MFVEPTERSGTSNGTQRAKGNNVGLSGGNHDYGKNQIFNVSQTIWPTGDTVGY